MINNGYCTEGGTWTRTAITDHWILSPACLAIPPLQHGCFILNRAKDGIWTRDPHLGKVVLYRWATFAWLIASANLIYYLIFQNLLRKIWKDNF